MPGLKISELSSSFAPSLTGVTPVVLDNTTYKSSLASLRQVLVDSGSHHFTGSQVINGNLVVSGSITAEQYILSSSITNLVVQNVFAESKFGNHLIDKHDFTGSVRITGSLSSPIITSQTLFVSGFAVIGEPIHHTGSEKEVLHVGSSGSINIAHFQGNNQHYAQVNITNIKSGSLASSDLSITADNGNETVHYVNLGINSSTYNGGFVGYENDAYLLNVGKDLYIGTVGGTNHPAKLMLFAQNNWVNPQMTIHTGNQITFNTSSFTEGYLYEFSGSVKLQDELSVNGSVTASYFIGDGSQLTNLPSGGGSIDSSSLATTGSNTFIGNQTITGSINFGDGGVIQSISSSSGDGGGYSTLTLTPDSSLNSDQYIILDPTGPNHIHIRPGGTIDNSNADLYIGGEETYLRVSDSSPSVRMQTQNDVIVNGYYFSIGSGYSSAEWYTESGNHYVKFNDPTMDVYHAMWSFNSPSTFTAWYNGGSNYISFTVLGSSTPGFPAAPSFYVAEAPPSSPTYLNSVDIEIRQNRQTYVNLSNNDININASDDLRLYARDRFQLRNYSPDEPIEIVLDYDNTDKTFAFNPDGSLGFPDSTIQTTAFTGFPENLVSGSLQISDLGFVTTSSFNQYTSSVQFVPTLYMIEAYANETYTLPGGFTEDPCRYSVVSVNENVPSNWFNTSTYRFTPQKAGYWEINACYDVYRNSEASIAIRKNGSIVASAGSFNAVAQQVIKIVYLNGSTDYIDIVNTGGGALQRYQYQQRSWFQAKWIGE